MNGARQLYKSHKAKKAKRGEDEKMNKSATRVLDSLYMEKLSYESTFDTGLEKVAGYYCHTQLRRMEKTANPLFPLLGAGVGLGAAVAGRGAYKNHIKSKNDTTLAQVGVNRAEYEDILRAEKDAANDIRMNLGYDYPKIDASESEWAKHIEGGVRGIEDLLGNERNTGADVMKKSINLLENRNLAKKASVTDFGMSKDELKELAALRRKSDRNYDIGKLEDNLTSNLEGDMYNQVYDAAGGEPSGKALADAEQRFWETYENKIQAPFGKVKTAPETYSKALDTHSRNVSENIRGKLDGKKLRTYGSDAPVNILGAGLGLGAGVALNKYLKK